MTVRGHSAAGVPALPARLWNAGERRAVEIEFAGSDTADDGEAERECFRMQNGRVSLRELAEEELLLALPLAPACSTPLTCGRAPRYATGSEVSEAAGEMRRPFSALQELLKKT